jgi:hypothetical protein
MTEPTYVIITIPQIGEVKIKSTTEYGKVNFFLGYIEGLREFTVDWQFPFEPVQAIRNKARDMGILEE